MCICTPQNAKHVHACVRTYNYTVCSGAYSSVLPPLLPSGTSCHMMKGQGTSPSLLHGQPDEIGCGVLYMRKWEESVCYMHSVTSWLYMYIHTYVCGQTMPLMHTVCMYIIYMQETMKSVCRTTSLDASLVWSDLFLTVTQ